MVDLSNFYLDIAKDRLYVSGAKDFRRRSCQTVLSLVVERLAGLIAPVLCHMAEDIWQNLPYPVAETSVFGRGWPIAPPAWLEATSAKEMAAVRTVRDSLRPAVNRLLETARAAGNLGASLEAQVHIQLPSGEASSAAGADPSGGDLAKQLSGEASGGASGEPARGSAAEASSKPASEAFAGADLLAIQALLAASPCPEVDNLADWLLVSDLRLGANPPEAALAVADEGGLILRVARAAGEKCERCWHHETDVSDHTLAEGVHGRICGRCRHILERQAV